MNLPERVAAHAAKLTETDRRILDVLLSHPTEAAFLPASQVTASAGAHVATATKLAQKLGYSGYPELRGSLQSELLSGASPADRVKRRLEQAGTADLLPALVTDEVAVLEDLPRQVPQSQLDQAAGLLREASHRYLFGYGNASVLSEMLRRRLVRFGLPTSVLPSDGRGLAEDLVGVRADDVVVAHALRRVPPHLPALLDHCATVGANVVVLTDTLRAELEPHVELVLGAARGSGREFQSLTVPMAIGNALVLTVARQDPRLTEGALADLEKLLAAFEE